MLRHRTTKSIPSPSIFETAELIGIRGFRNSFGAKAADLRACSGGENGFIYSRYFIERMVALGFSPSYLKTGA
ncbi:hypothetical protein HPP92_013288 [Vanilla planifolia]|uniref:Uncharacterized protein n=1 Tax=Vanilla planifolia TaxID=51239 RepID=A0A835UWL3_VANPL|nr:hypothetical protein HPP92_013288 [Vanilla planifolia]